MDIPWLIYNMGKFARLSRSMLCISGVVIACSDIDQAVFARGESWIY